MEEGEKPPASRCYAGKSLAVEGEVGAPGGHALPDGLVEIAEDAEREV